MKLKENNCNMARIYKKIIYLNNNIFMATIFFLKIGTNLRKKNKVF